jgi:hypothetical protein
MAPRTAPEGAVGLGIAEVALTVWHTSWERSGELATEGEPGDPVESFRRCRAELRRIVG